MKTTETIEVATMPAYIPWEGVAGPGLDVVGLPDAVGSDKIGWTKTAQILPDQFKLHPPCHPRGPTLGGGQPKFLAPGGDWA